MGCGLLLFLGQQFPTATSAASPHTIIDLLATSIQDDVHTCGGLCMVASLVGLEASIELFSFFLLLVAMFIIYLQASLASGKRYDEEVEWVRGG